MYKSIVYEGDKPLGEVEVYTQNKDFYYQNQNAEILRISHYSQPSERCSPLAVLYTITATATSSSDGLCLKMETKSQSKELYLLHSSCIRDKKTAVILLEGKEIHLVAMPSRKDEGRSQYFWGFLIAPGLYSSCLVMLNLRCLGIVFDLDETLVVANTMRSFEDRIDALQRKLSNEVDPQRINGMLAEIKRYQDDKIVLKQYAENDQVVENGRVIKSQSEVVPALSDNHPSIVRPIIRLQDKNIILTRINPLIRDTSVLVRLRPAWEDLRSYLMARGRKRFEVFVCTMAERDYALEMWRLLDPDLNLINSKELLDRLVCVKSGSKKSLFNVFLEGNCHPNMALVIDDRLKVWDEEDQPRVHVVPAFAPYYAPQAEANNAIPVLCVARNVACNVRGGFFKDFDDGMLQRISEVMYEDDIKGLPPTPDVSNYLISEDDASTLNVNKDAVGFDGMADAEVERRLKEAVPVPSTVPLTVSNQDPRFAHLQYAIAPSPVPVPPPISVPPPIPVPTSTFQGPGVPFPVKPLPQMTSVAKPLGLVGPTEAGLRNSPAREEGEVAESEVDPDTRRRLLILQHGHDTREVAAVEPQIPVRPPLQVPVPRVQPCGNWLPAEEEMNPRLLNHMAQPQEFPLNKETLHIEQQRQHPSPFLRKMENLMVPDRLLENQRFLQEAIPRDDRMRQNYPMPGYHSFPGEEIPLGPSSSSSKNLEFEPVKFDVHETPDGALQDTPPGALQEIAFRCGTKVEFRSTMVPSMELQFSMEILFAGEKVGEAIGRTRREAQHQAAEVSLMNLADKFLSHLKPDSVSLHGEGSKFSNANENGFVGDASSFGYQSSYKEESPSVSSAPEPPRVSDPRLEGSKKSMGSITALQELCMAEGLGVAFQSQPPPSANPNAKNEVYAQVEVDGHVLGEGMGLTLDEAKMLAAEKALGNLRNMLGQFSEKRPGSPREVEGMPNKRLKPEDPRIYRRMPSSRYPKNASLVP